jgi:hypothetical protein
VDDRDTFSGCGRCFARTDSLFPDSLLRLYTIRGGYRCGAAGHAAQVRVNCVAISFVSTVSAFSMY